MTTPRLFLGLLLSAILLLSACTEDKPGKGDDTDTTKTDTVDVVVAPLPGEQPEMMVGIWRLKDMTISGELSAEELSNLQATKARQLKEQQLTLNADGSYDLITPVGNQPGNVQNLSGDWAIEDGNVFHVRGNPTAEYYDSYEILTMEDNSFVYLDTLYRMKNKMVYVRAKDGEVLVAGPDAAIDRPLKTDEPAAAPQTNNTAPKTESYSPSQPTGGQSSDVKKGTPDAGSGGSDVKKGGSGGSDVKKGGSDVKKGGG